jgi:hypothetical protein
MFQKSWIFCENEITKVDDFVFKNWQERLFFERLERKSKLIFELLEDLNQDWEAVLFCLLARNFGLNTNGEAFFELAKSIPFSVIRKEAFEVGYLEALFFGQANLLSNDFQDVYAKQLLKEYSYLVNKHQISDEVFGKVEFFKHRPDNFPTIRLSQLANLYHSQQNLFSKIIHCSLLSEIYKVFDVGVSDYWETHYVFDKESKRKTKKLSKSFVNLLVVNTILPLRFAYASIQQKDCTQEIIDLAFSIPSEENTIIEKFRNLNLQSKSVFDSQALIQMKKEYCDFKKCLDCAVGHFILKK